MEWQTDFRNLMIMAVLSFPFGMGLRMMSDDLVKGLAVQKKRRIWLTATYFILLEALVTGYLSPLRWQSILVVGSAIPILGYIAMLGITSVKAKRISKEV